MQLVTDLNNLKERIFRDVKTKQEKLNKIRARYVKRYSSGGIPLNSFKDGDMSMNAGSLYENSQDNSYFIK